MKEWILKGCIEIQNMYALQNTWWKILQNQKKHVKIQNIVADFRALSSVIGKTNRQKNSVNAFKTLTVL